MHSILSFLYATYLKNAYNLADIKEMRANKNKKKNRRRKDHTKDLSSKNANENQKVRVCVSAAFVSF